MNFQILGTGSSHPSCSVTNDELAALVETSDEWIRTRTGIHSRYVSTGETMSDLTAEAALRALENAGTDASELDLILCSTIRGDYLTPSQACMIQQRIGASCPALDINAACSGFLYALDVAAGYFARGRVKKVLIVSAEMLSELVDWTDRATCVLFGDGAGAAVIRLSDNHAYHCVLGARGDTALLHAGGAGCDERFVHMEGKAVFRFASDTVPKCVMQVLDTAGLTMKDIDYVVCHQANGRIIDHVMKKLNAPAEKFYKNMQSYANTSAASIAIALDEMNEKGLLKPGTRIVCVGFGAGLTWGGTLLTF